MASTLWALALVGGVSRVDGAILFAGISLYTLFAIRLRRRERPESHKVPDRAHDLALGGDAVPSLQREDS